MKKNKIFLSFIIGIICLLGALSFKNIYFKNETIVNAQTTKDDRQFKAVWVTPLVGDVSVNGEQAFKDDMLEALTIMEHYGLNALIFHVRTHNNALYPSNINPKASYVSNIDFNRFDPIDWLITESHKRGIELHAWMNPYRYGVSQQVGNMPHANPQSSSSNTLEGKILNPALPDVKNHIYDTIDEFVNLYPTVDAIHFDDYFYVSTSAYPNNANDRRAHINELISGIHNRLKTFNETNNRYVQFGISPTGIYKNGDGKVTYDSYGNPITTGSNTRGQQHYEDYLYADTLKWISEGWLDYIAPQVYWARDLSAAPFNNVLSWWNKVVKYLDVNLYSGIGLYKADDATYGAGWYNNLDEMNAQFNIIENDLENVLGYSIYSFRHLKRAYNGDTTSVGHQVNNAYSRPDRKKIKVLPEINSMTKVTPASVVVSHVNDRITWSSVSNAKFYYIYESSGNLTYSNDEIIGVIGNQEGLNSFQVTNYNSSNNYGVRALSFTNHLSPILEEEPIEIYNITYNLNGGELDLSLYQTREEMIVDFLTDFYEFVNPQVNLNTFMHGPGKTEGYDGLYDGDYFDLLYRVNDKTINPSTNRFINQSKYNKWVPLIDLMEEYTYKGYPPQSFWGSKYVGQRRIKPFIQQKSLWEEDGEPKASIIMEIMHRIPSFNESDNNIYYQYTENYPEIILPNALKEGYRFLGWYTENDGGTRITSIPRGSTGDKSIYARWEEKAPTVPEYLVTFNLAYEEKYLSSLNVSEGSTVLRPNDPKREHYNFLGWYLNEELFDFNIEVFSNINLVAKWEFTAYIVSFYDEDILIKEDIVSYGKDATAPNIPVKEGYIFLGWDKSYNNITSNINVYAQYSVAKYFVEFINSDGEIFDSVLVNHGKKVAEIDQPYNEGLQFLGWHLNDDLFDFNTPIIEDVILVAWWGNTRYTVSFLNADNSVFLTQSVEKGEMLSKPISNPKKPGYSFNYWTLNNEVYNFNNPVNSNLQLKASWSVLVHTIRFLNYDLTELFSETVEHDTKLLRPENDPLRVGYSFRNWYLGDLPFDFTFAIYEDMDLVAKWDINLYEVEFLDWDNSVLSHQLVAHGSGATLPKVPNTKEGHSFKTWDKDYNNITSNTKITAVYEANNIFVILVDDDNSHIDTLLVKYGSKITKPADPYKEGHVFRGWLLNEELFDFETVVYNDLELKASWEIGGNEVTFLNYDESVFIKQRVNDGSFATKPLNEPKREGYIFTGWLLGEEEFNFNTPIYSNITLKPSWDFLVHTVKFLDEEIEFQKQLINHGSKLVKPFNEPVKEGYTFLGWYLGDLEYNFNLAVHEDFNLIAKWEINIYKVEFLDWDNSILSVQTVVHGSSATLPASPNTKEGHSFKTWDKDYNNITSDIKINAVYEANNIFVILVDDDNSHINTLLVKYGSKITEPNNPNKLGHKFAGWLLDGVIFDFETLVYNDLELKASWQINIYEIVFLNQGNPIRSKMVNHGDKVTKLESEPTRENFEFAGWYLDGALYDFNEPVKRDFILIAAWTSVSYSVTFLNDDKTTFKTVNVLAGSQVIRPLEEPIKEGNDFNGWLIKGIKYNFSWPVTNNLVLTPDFSLTNYDVLYLDSDSSLIESTTVEHGKKLTPPDVPIKEGYKFLGWHLGDLEFDFSMSVYETTELVARWEINTYTVRFYDGQVLLKIEEVQYLHSATPPSNLPEKESYFFSGWDKSYIKVKENLIISATYVKKTFNVVFKDHQNTIDTIIVEYGDSAVAPSPTYREGYMFVSWDKEFINVKEDLIVTAIYERISFNINYYDFYDNVIKSEVVAHGEKVNPPVAPFVEGAEFIGWLTSENNEYNINLGVENDLDLYSNYLFNRYTVKFIDYDEAILKTEEVTHGNPATPPEEPTREGYIFSGWDLNYNEIKSDLTIQAKYTKEGTNNYLVTFQDEEGHVYASKVVSENEKVLKIIDPNKEGHRFIGWYLNNHLFDFETLINSNIILTAKFDVDEYEVIYQDDKGVVERFTVLYKETIIVPEVPNKLGYFGVWDKDLSNIEIKKDYFINAVYTLRDYNITYENVKGASNLNPLTHTIIEVVILEPLINEENSFLGWYDENDNEITILAGAGDKVIYAKWLENDHKVTFIDYEGAIIDVVNVLHGKDAVAPVVPKRKHYIHTGWDKSFTNVRSDLTVQALYEGESYLLRFLNYDESLITEESIIYPNLPISPKTPTRIGYSFKGWYLSTNYQNEFNFKKPLNKNQNIYAKWEVKTYVVTFLDDLDNVIEQTTVEHGKSVNEPKGVYKEHYMHVGWDKPLNNITQNQNIRAIFKVNEYILSFISNGGSKVPSNSYQYLYIPKEPERPFKEGYDFVGWYEDELFESKFSFNEPVKENKTLYARWLKSLDDNKYISMYDTASIRYKTETSLQGLKFSARLDKDITGNVHGFYIVFGSCSVDELRIAINNNGSDQLFINSKKVFKVEVPNIDKDNRFCVILTGIPEAGYLDLISAIGYVVVDEKQQFTSTSTTKSIAEVAFKNINYGLTNNALAKIINNVEQKMVYRINNSNEIELNNSYYEYNNQFLKEEFKKDFIKVLEKEFNDLLTNESDLDEFYKNNYIKDKWSFLLDYLLSLSTNENLNEQINNIKNKKSNRSLKELLYALTNFFNEENNLLEEEVIDFTNSSNYKTLKDYNNKIYINPHKYKLYNVGYELTLPEVKNDKEGYVFDHYLIDSEHYNELDKYVIRNKPVTVKRVYNKEVFTVTYIKDQKKYQQEQYNPQEILKTLPEVYKHQHYFLGWYDENDVLFKENTVITKNITLTAKFKQINYLKNIFINIDQDTYEVISHSDNIEVHLTYDYNYLYLEITPIKDYEFSNDVEVVVTYNLSTNAKIIDYLFDNLKINYTLDDPHYSGIF